jgi:anti-sigma B factor antagonist
MNREVRMAAPLKITERRAGPVAVLEFSGHLVADEGASWCLQQVSLLVTAGWLNILVDLRNVTYMDSGGVGALVASFVHVSRRGGRLKLLCPSPRCARVLGISGLSAVFEVFENEEEALRSFAPPSISVPVTAGRR